MNSLKGKLKAGAITKETFEQFANQSDLHERLLKAETVEEARKIVNSVNEYVECNIGFQRTHTQNCKHA